MGFPQKSFKVNRDQELLRRPSLSLIPVLFLALLPLLCSPSSAAEEKSIYDHLRSNRLPIGLLPEGITEYTLDPTTGRFEINLTQPCNALRSENQLHYDFNVSGSLSLGRIANLSGVSQQDLFLWFQVKGIRVDLPSSGLIYFDVGVVDKQFSLSLFENPLECTASDQDIQLSNPPKKQSNKLALQVGLGEASRATS